LSFVKRGAQARRVAQRLLSLPSGEWTLASDVVVGIVGVGPLHNLGLNVKQLLRGGKVQ
jgi:hypothetical protein